MSAPITVNYLIDEVRSLTKESNNQPISDSDILRALNRGARKFYKLISRIYSQLYLESYAATTDGTQYLDIPEDAFGRNIMFITYEYAGTTYRIDNLAPSEGYKYETDYTTASPLKYSTKGSNKIIIYPTPNSGITVTIWYMKRPGTLVESQGKILNIDTSNNKITLDDVGSNLATTVGDNKAFVSLIDAQTGLSKVNLQISNVDSTDSIITFKSSGLDRSTVYGKTIGTSIPSTVELDDYICSVEGTCVFEMMSDFSDYITQYAVVDIRSSLDLDTSTHYAKLKNIEDDVKAIWAGRENSSKVKNKSIFW